MTTPTAPSAAPPRPLLPPRSRIAVIAPAGAVQEAEVEQGIALLESWDYQVVRGEHLYHRHRYNAGTGAERSADLNWALTHPEVDAVWLARGGYGCVHCLPRLPQAMPPQRLVIGLSDATALLCALHRRGHTQLLHGPMVEGLAVRVDDETRTAVHRLLTTGTAPSLHVKQLSGPAVPVTGTLLGGNLTVLASIAGTPWAMQAEGGVLLLEDVGEAPYRLDRSLTQLIESGALTGVRAVVLGEFVRCPLPADGSYAIEDVLRDALQPLHIPVYYGAPFGHGSRNLPWRYGDTATLDSGRLVATPTTTATTGTANPTPATVPAPAAPAPATATITTTPAPTARRHTPGLLALLLMLLAFTTPGPPARAAAAALGAAAMAPPVTLDEVLVTGERPGPGLWRVSKDGHDLWILGTLEPLPEKMIWRSEAVEARISAAQTVLAPPRVTPDVGFFHGLTLIPALLRARKNPAGDTLEHTLPHDLYIRWLALRVKYLGSTSDEKMRPLVAAVDVYMHALDDSGLTSDESIWKVVEHTARQHRVRIEPVVLKLPIADPQAAIRELGHIPRAAEVDCLAKTIDRLETDLQPMRQRANRWALGDIAGLRALPYPDEQVACFDAVFSVPSLRAQFQHAEADLIDTWLAAAAAALARNTSTFGVLSIGELLKPSGALAQLRARGYAVQEP